MLNNCSMYTKTHQITLYLYDGQGERAHSIRRLSIHIECKENLGPLRNFFN